jgi:hypothetical protein
MFVNAVDWRFQETVSTFQQPCGGVSVFDVVRGLHACLGESV